MRSSRIDLILRSLREISEPVRVQGLSAPARALLVARYVQDSPDPVLVICPNDDAAAELADDLECLARVLEGRTLAASVFPTWEQSPYSPIAPSIRTRLARVGALARLHENGTQTILCSSLPAIAQATIPVTDFEAFSISLEKDGSIESREALVQRLLEAGYLQVDPVEDPGTFAVRGDIIDVFPPQLEEPVRIELWGDVVEKIRPFEPSSQRARDREISKLRLPPAREVLINRKTSASLRERVKARADDLGISRAVRDPILASIHEGVFPDHSDAWAPFAYENRATLLDHLPPGTRVVWGDELSISQNADSFLEEQKKLSSAPEGSGSVLPAVESLFSLGDSLDRRLRELARLYLDQVALADLSDVPTSEADAPTQAGELVGAQAEPEPTARHRADVRTNSDLGRGSKHSLGELEPKFRLWLKQGFKIVVLASTTSQLERIRFLLDEREIPCRMGPPEGGGLIAGAAVLAEGQLSEGFRWPAEGLVVLTEGDVVGARHVKRGRSSRASRDSASAAKDWAGLQALSDLSIGDAVVHVDHGIGRYQGLSRLELSGAPADFLLLEYANRDKLYLPVYRLNVIQKYAGVGAAVTLDKLGSQQFAKTKEKVREAVKKLAFDLIELYAQRSIRPGARFSPRDAVLSEFEAAFPFDETPDQMKAIDAILFDMESGKVMDRLVCGDVGYGKTEVAMRAAFRAVTEGKQVAVLVPTTVLAFQHEQSFRSRFKDYPIRIESVSRFKSAKEQKAVLEDAAGGKVDVLIGTHRLLSKDVRFKDLALVIVDEEHRFGVEHKERLKTLKLNTHVLTLTATPIPRTLHMALSGLREISLINTPPVDRLPIRTFVSKYDDSLIQRAIDFELSRGGQVFFLHNRVQTIHEIATRIQELVPAAKVIVAHGQMGEGELERAMLEFYEKKGNVLVCTTIIESGLDVPTANTMIINRADSLGLAQLYQIRGRVGRGQARAYAYLMIPDEGAVTEDAKKRLEVIQRFVELGSGFSVASHDLEIRGGGDLLGPQQSGHIAAVGFDLYTELLEEAIREIQGKTPAPEQSRREPEIKVPYPAFLADTYVPDVHQRLSLYRRCSAAENEATLDLLEQELRDRFGPLPPEAQSLLWLIRIKQLLKQLGVDALTVGPERASLVPGPASQLDPVRAVVLVSAYPKIYQLTPDSKLVVKIPSVGMRDLYFALETLLKQLASSAPRA
jgi:transcription-repair coupling factor (superfamily II helicase)